MVDHGNVVGMMNLAIYSFVVGEVFKDEPIVAFFILLATVLSAILLACLKYDEYKLEKKAKEDAIKWRDEDRKQKDIALWQERTEKLGLSGGKCGYRR